MRYIRFISSNQRHSPKIITPNLGTSLDRLNDAKVTGIHAGVDVVH